MKNPQFNPSKIDSDARRWIVSSKRIAFDGARNNLRQFVDGMQLEFGLVDVSASFHDLAVWYETSFIVEANDGELKAAQSLTQSFDCNLWEALVIDKYWSQLTEVPFGKGLDDYALYLAKGISIGSFDDATSLGDLILNNRQKPGWFTSDGNAVTNYVLALFCRWQGREWSGYHSRSRYGFYHGLIDGMLERDTEAIAGHLYEACDFHVERSRNLTVRDHPEFDQPFARVYPSEILAVLSLRRNAGLDNPTIDHPLLKLPTSQDFVAVKGEDSLLAPAKQRLISDYDLRQR